MNQNLVQLLEKLTHEEQAELETFAAFLVGRRDKKLLLLSDDVSTDQLTHLVSDSGEFAWLDAPEEDVYFLEDGQPVQWPSGHQ
jgi:hypothetical protein